MGVGTEGGGGLVLPLFGKLELNFFFSIAFDINVLSQIQMLKVISRPITATTKKIYSMDCHIDV